MLVDADSIAIAKHKIQKLAEDAIQGLATGEFYENGNFSVAKYERQRGVITGLGMAISALEETIRPPTPSDTHSEEETDEHTDQG